jgi:polyhydroxybutyrate depolymerase
MSFAAALLCTACDEGRAPVAGGADGGADAAAARDAAPADVDFGWPTVDPDPDGGVHSGPAFGDGGAGGDGGAPPAACTGKTGPTGGHVVAIVSGGLPRTAILHVPPSYDPREPAMLVFNFHGFGSADYQEELLTRMDDASDARGFLVVYPAGVAAGWNAGFCCGDAWTGGVDDVGFVRDLLAEIGAAYCVDPRRIYATGMSNGAFLSHRLGCEASDIFAAIAPVAGVLGLAPAACQPSRPVPVLEFNGTSDPLVPYEGGTPLLGVPVAGWLNFPSVADTMAIWRAKNGDVAPGATIYDHGDATCVRWDGGAPVILCTIDGGGHTWPGGVPLPTLGKTSTDISATDTMLDFFAANPLP